MFLNRFNQFKSISSSDFGDGYLALLFIAFILIILFGFVFWIAWIITGYRQWKNRNRVITTTEYLWTIYPKNIRSLLQCKIAKKKFFERLIMVIDSEGDILLSFYADLAFFFDLKLIAFLRFTRNLECIYFKMNMKKNKETKVNKE